MNSRYLIHYGVKGMKWGVRHDREKSLKNNRFKLTEKQKKRLIIGLAVTGTVLAVAGGVYISKYKKPSYGVLNVSLDSLQESLNMFKDDNAVNLKPGTTFQRISGDAVGDTISRGEAYVSYKFRDNMKYKDRMPKMSWVNTPYIHKIKCNESIKAPSSREAASIFLKQHPESSHAEYMNFIQQEIRNSNSVKRNAFVKELNKRGFNAVIDDNDLGWSKSPLILLDPSKYVNGTKTRKLTAAERVAAVYFK